MKPITILPGFLLDIPREASDSLSLKPGLRMEFSIHDATLQLRADHTLPLAGHNPPPRPCGLCKGEFTVPDDFNEFNITES